MFYKQRKCFTLLELLVVIVIIGLFATITVVSLSSFRKRSRDAKRISDLKEIQKALELYALSNNNKYPTSLDILISEKYLSVQPTDPLNRNMYFYRYCVNSNASTYHLAAKLEDLNNKAFQGDADLPEGKDGCSRSIDGSDGKNAMYDLVP